MLGEAEIQKFKLRYDHLNDTYRSLYDHIMSECTIFKKQNPNTIRLFFSRDPIIKTFDKIIEKIGRKRKDEASYNYEDLTDILAFTALCPYKSDFTKFTIWLRRSFDVRTSDVDAVTDYTSGHRALHYLVRAHQSTIARHSIFNNIVFEIQVKTIIEEAFDAKSHDLTYKHGISKPSETLEKQFALLSSVLKVIDEQSEFLKNTIQAEQELKSIHHQSAIAKFLSDELTKNQADKLSIDIENLEALDISELISKITAENKRLAKEEKEIVDRSFCSLIALCALKLQDDYIRQLALESTKLLIKSAPEMEKSNGRNNIARAYVSKGSVEWALNYYEQALESTNKAINLSGNDMISKEDPTVHNTAIQNFIYFLADFHTMTGSNVSPLQADAKTYIEKLKDTHLDPETKDTLGFYYIVFGNREEIDIGRSMIKESYQAQSSTKEADSAKQFYVYHENVALIRLKNTLE